VCTFTPRFEGKAGLPREVVGQAEVEVCNTKLKSVGMEQRTIFSHNCRFDAAHQV
jgi:hypothetical protein